MVLASSAVTSLLAILWSWRHDALLNYGDAIAHLHIARRVFDSHRPGLQQLGSVWLPLPHLLLIPFVAVYSWWANGIAGIFPSATAYIASCLGMYRLARHWLHPSAAVVAFAFLATNPNLLYLQTTAMTEPLFLCEMVWLTVWLVEWRASLEDNPHRTGGLLWQIAFVLVAAVFTRYDGWILAVVFGDWLDFARGPYSAAAIELRTATPGSGPPHPGWHNPWVSFLFFVKTAQMDATAEAWGNTLLALSLAGTVWATVTARSRAFLWTLLLWLPVPFYAYSISFGSVPIFIPVWWPHSWYNTRYGLELLPAFALGLAFVAQFMLAVAREFKPKSTVYAAPALCAIILLNAWAVVREKPLAYIEGIKNVESRRTFEADIPPVLRSLLAQRPGGVVLMNTSVFPQLVSLTGIPLRQTINESDKQFYTEALAAPASHAAVVLAFEGDEIDRAIRAHPEGLQLVRRFRAPGQPLGTVYVSDTFATPMTGSSDSIGMMKP